MDLKWPVQRVRWPSGSNANETRPHLGLFLHNTHLDNRPQTPSPQTQLAELSISPPRPFKPFSYTPARSSLMIATLSHQVQPQPNSSLITSVPTSFLTSQPLRTKLPNGSAISYSTKMTTLTTTLVLIMVFFLPMACVPHVNSLCHTMNSCWSDRAPTNPPFSCDAHQTKYGNLRTPDWSFIVFYSCYFLFLIGLPNGAINSIIEKANLTDIRPGDMPQWSWRKSTSFVTQMRPITTKLKKQVKQEKWQLELIYRASYGEQTAGRTLASGSSSSQQTIRDSIS